MGLTLKPFLVFGGCAFPPVSLGPAGLWSFTAGQKLVFKVWQATARAGTLDIGVFGLWRIRFPPVLVRTGRRLPVHWQALGGLWSLESVR